MSITFTSMNDGHTGSRTTSFASACPNTYEIRRDGEVVGYITPLSNGTIEAFGRLIYIENDRVWNVSAVGIESKAFQYLRDAKTYAKTAIN